MFFGVSSQKSAKNLAFQRVRKIFGFYPILQSKMDFGENLGRTEPRQKYDSAGPLTDDR